MVMINPIISERLKGNPTNFEYLSKHCQFTYRSRFPPSSQTRSVTKHMKFSVRRHLYWKHPVTLLFWTHLRTIRPAKVLNIFTAILIYEDIYGKNRHVSGVKCKMREWNHPKLLVTAPCVRTVLMWCGYSNFNFSVLLFSAICTDGTNMLLHFIRAVKT